MEEILLHHRKSGKMRTVNPQRFALWLFIISMIMLFAALTSAYLVKKSEGDWLIFNLPSLFNVSSVLIIVSSFTMQFAYFSAKKDNILNIKIGLGLSAALAVAFSICQYLAWGELVAQDVFFVGNPSGSFIYVFTGLHLAHLLGGLIFLIITFSKTLKFGVHSKSTLTIEMCTTYWHFLGGLWLYLYLFLIANN